MIDNALYNAFGQRLVSTIFTQTNQYRVVLEVQPEFSKGLAALDGIYVNAPNAAAAAAAASAARAAGAPVPAQATSLPQIPLSATRAGARAHGAARREPHRPVSRGHDFVQPRARRVARRRRQGDRGGAARHRPARERAGEAAGRGARVPRLAREPAVADPGRDRHRLHRPRRALRELHPSDHDPVDAAVGGRGRAARARAHRQRPRA